MQASETLKSNPATQVEFQKKWEDRLKKTLDVPIPEKNKEKVDSGLKKAWTAFGDMVRDVGTASSMAKERFEGDSALMHAARGAVTLGVGAGLEKAMDFVWDKVWSGEIPFYDKSKFGEGMAEGLNKFAVKNDLAARTTYLVKESAQDLSLAIFYNFLAFRGQPILPKTGAEHLVRSLWVNILEAFISPSLPLDEKIKAEKGNVGMFESKIDRAKDAWHNVDRIRINSPHIEKGESGKEIMKANFVPLYPEDAQKALDKLKNLIAQNQHHKKELSSYKDDFHPSSVESFIRGISGFSNPITQLGAEWLILSFKTLKDHYIEVRKAREEKGGLSGKKVLMPKKDKWHGRQADEDYRGKYDYKKKYDSHSRWEERKNDGKDKKKIYFGQGNANEAISEEELIEKIS